MTLYLPKKNTTASGKEWTGTCWTLEMTVPEIGRIKRSTGTPDEDTAKRIEAMLQSCVMRGELETLALLQQGKITPLGLYNAMQSKRLKQFLSEAKAEKLKAAAEDYLDRDQWTRSRKYWVDCKSVLQGLLREAGEHASLSQVPEALKNMRKRWVKAEQLPAWNRARAIVLGFLASCDGAEQIIERVKKLKRAKVSRTERLRLSPQQAAAVAALIEPDDVRAAWWAMCTLGAGPAELATISDPPGQSIFLIIRGTKVEQRERSVPKVLVSPPDTVEMHRIRTALQRIAITKAGDVIQVSPPTRPSAPGRANRQPNGRSVVPLPEGAVRVSAYDARRAYAAWLVEAGIVRVNRLLFLGHTLSVHDMYEKDEHIRHLASAQSKLRALLSQAGVALLPTRED